MRAPTLAERAAAWDRDDPDELRRAADEWERYGHARYATYLRAWARGERPRPMPHPFGALG